MNKNTIKNNYKDISDDVIDILDRLDVITYNHSLRVYKLAQYIEKEFNYKDKELSEAALLHDIGKYYISENILNKPDNLNIIERKIIDLHSYLSYYILKTNNINKNVCEIVLYHHNNNPPTLEDIGPINISDELKEKVIILKTLDIYDALISDRPYKRGFKKATVIEIMKDMKDVDNKVLQYLSNTTEFDRK